MPRRDSALPSTSGRGAGGEGRFRDRRGETLFIDARQMGSMVDRTHRELTDDDIAKIAGTYHAWRDERGLAQAEQSEDVPVPALQYEDISGYCKAATLDEVRAHSHVLTPGRYVGAPEAEEDDEPFEEKMARLTSDLSEQLAESKRLEDEIRKNLEGLGFDV